MSKPTTKLITAWRSVVLELVAMLLLGAIFTLTQAIVIYVAMNLLIVANNWRQQK